MVNALIRYVSTISCLLLASFTLQAATLEEQRNYFDQAKTALEKNNPLVYYSHKKALQGYPLEPYLAYLELNKRVKLASDDEIILFVKKHQDLPQTRWLEMRWLRLVAERGDWNTFLKYYQADSFSELDCFYGQYLYQTNQITKANELAEKLWLKPHSQPNACDVVFNDWERQGKMTADMRWQRLKMALEAKEYRLANHIVGLLPASLIEQGKEFTYVAKNPNLIAKTQSYQGRDKITGDIVGLGLRRLARQDPEQALSLLQYYETRLQFSDEQKVDLANDIGLTFARRYDARALPILAKYDANLDHNDVSEWHVRLLLRLNRWQQAQELIDRLPEQLAQTNRWKYWKIRVAQYIDPKDPKIIEQYSQLAQERDFYGFLAAQRVNASYQFNHQPIIVNNNMVLKIKNMPAIQRAIEYLYKGMDNEAWIEWHNLTRNLSQQEMLALSQLAYDMNLYFYAIRTLAITSYWDDLTIRFPIAYKDILVKEADNRSISPNWAFAIMRQESAFNDRIKSHAGAMGLMQLMPATAKETAKKFDIPLANPQEALNPNTNIQLGTAFLGQMYERFQNNRILASAAYNAGPGRVRQWLQNANNVDFDVWIETIPFNETRQYVQNVLFYSVIYGHKLNIPQVLIEDHEMNFASTN
ncbi:transglycosylase SLT domain-containing protein [Entomomonas asaccharolytica]|uniref:Transglycosylase SLT domain-containing protein n=1 Tax=Entomomonas asaccharolytica TaxID=2785331 RepID=A0A974NHM5_9GAMM|nr:transglycosylase SLT domain-containing protein [Entomomonas asaccharolytica]QQP86712.1 transglycosylase SLT domain-containing protein [Entomomonas asaccharolytica]